MAAKTVLVTGATGYIAKHIVLQLLNEGHSVVASLRNPDREAKLRAALALHLDDPSALDMMRTVVLDLRSDEGWDGAMQGVDAVIHTASPFPMSVPKDEQDLIRPAVDGALRVLRSAHAAGITRMVLTSSVAAVSYCDLPEGKTAYDENDWTDINSPATTAYAKSKTMAEQAAWQWVAANSADMKLTVINPGWVLGPPLDKSFGTSVGVVRRFLKGTDPMLPDLHVPCVDVRDVAMMHVRALAAPQSYGKRIISADRSLSFPEMGRLLKAAYPDRKIPTRKAPNVLIRVLALFDRALRQAVPLLGFRIEVSNAQARKLLDMKFRDPRDSLRETADFLVENNLV